MLTTIGPNCQHLHRNSYRFVQAFPRTSSVCTLILHAAFSSNIPLVNSSTLLRLHNFDAALFPLFLYPS